MTLSGGFFHDCTFSVHCYYSEVKVLNAHSLLAQPGCPWIQNNTGKVDSTSSFSDVPSATSMQASPEGQQTLRQTQAQSTLPVLVEL